MTRRLLFIDGLKINKLTILHRIEDNKQKVRCICDCGNIGIYLYQNIRQGLTKSCGCYLKCFLKIQHKTRKNRIIYNISLNRLRCIYGNMKKRCYYEKSPNYKYYGGRGILICKEWELFEGFYKDMGEDYKKHIKEFGEKETSIDRINGNGNYCKENCRRVTRKEQTLNRNI